MSTIDHAGVTVEDAEPTPAEKPSRRRRFWFWVARYLPAEIAGTAAMILAGLGVTLWTDNAAVIAAAAVIGEFAGFYLVLAITIHLEQTRLGFSARRALGRTVMLLVAEFGAAELLDTFLIRPAAIILGVWLLPDPVWGLLAGKIVADVVFYAIAAGAFTLTVRTGLRRRGAKEQEDAA